jgi:hypothetical protein
MELHVTGELETKLTQSAAKQRRNPDELVKEVLTRYFEEETNGGAAEPTPSRDTRELPVWRLGATGSFHRRDIYSDVH